MRGGAREGAGRKVGYRKPEGVRASRNLRAYDEEWEIIKEFSKLVKTDIEKAKTLLDLLKKS